MREDLSLKLQTKECLVCDGAMGTMLQAAGLTSGDCPELWNVTNPEAILAVHHAYLAAGSNIIETNTFGGTRLKLSRYGLQDRTVELNKAGASLARKAAGEDRYVAASIGPTGEFLEPLGDIPFDEAVDVYQEQAQALADGGADALLLETFSDLSELLAALKGAQKTGLPVFGTMSFDTGGRTMMGVSPSDAAKSLEEAGAAGVGSNCGGGPEELFRITKELRAATSLPLVIQPNAGLPEYVDGRTVFPATPELMADYALRFADLGVKIIGGCCGTTPAHLEAIAKTLRK